MRDFKATFEVAEEDAGAEEAAEEEEPGASRVWKFRAPTIQGAGGPTWRA